MELTGRVVMRGKAKGKALVTGQQISFYGGVDLEKGVVIEKGHELKGKSIKDAILVFPQGKGSTVGSYALYRLKKSRLAPAGIINRECEPIVAVGAIISEIPMVDKIDIKKIKNGARVEISDGKVIVS